MGFFSKLLPFASWPGTMINPQWLELPMWGTNLHGLKDVRAIDVRLLQEMLCSSSYSEEESSGSEIMRKFMLCCWKCWLRHKNPTQMLRYSCCVYIFFFFLFVFFFVVFMWYFSTACLNLITTHFICISMRVHLNLCDPLPVESIEHLYDNKDRKSHCHGCRMVKQLAIYA